MTGPPHEEAAQVVHHTTQTADTLTHTHARKRYPDAIPQP